MKTKLFLAISILFAYISCTEDVPTPEKPIDPPSPPGVTTDTITYNIRIMDDFVGYQDWAKTGRDTVGIANVMNDIPTDSIHFYTVLRDQYNLTRNNKDRISKQNDKKLIAGSDTVFVTPEMLKLIGDGKWMSLDNSFTAKTLKDSLDINALTGNKFPVIDLEKIAEYANNTHRVNSQLEFIPEIMAVADKAQKGTATTLIVACDVRVAKSDEELIAKLLNEKITVMVESNGRMIAKESDIELDGELVAKLVKAGVLQNNHGTPYLIVVKENVEAVLGLGYRVQVPKVDSFFALSNEEIFSPVLDLTSRNNTEIDMDSLRVLEGITGKKSTVTVLGDALWKNFNAGNAGKFSGPTTPGSGSDFEFEVDPMITSVGDLGGKLHVLCGPNTAGKLLVSLLRRNPGLKLDSYKDKELPTDWESYKYRPEGLIYPTFSNNDPVTAILPTDEKYYDQGKASWSPFIGMRFESFYGLAHLAHCVNGRDVIYDSSNSVFMLTFNHRYGWLNGENSEEKIMAQMPECIKLSTPNFGYDNDTGWAAAVIELPTKVATVETATQKAAKRNAAQYGKFRDRRVENMGRNNTTRKK